MSHDDFLDQVRTTSAFFAAMGFTLMTCEIKYMWRRISGARKLRYLSLVMFSFAITYGSLEAAYWPEHNLRVLWVLLAAASSVAAGVAGLMEHRKKGRQS